MSSAYSETFCIKNGDTIYSQIKNQHTKELSSEDNFLQYDMSADCAQTPSVATRPEAVHTLKTSSRPPTTPFLLTAITTNCLTMSLRQPAREDRYLDHQSLYDPFAEQYSTNVSSNAEVAQDHKPTSSLYSPEHMREQDTMDAETSSTNYLPSNKNRETSHYNFQSDPDFRQSSASDLIPLGYSDDDPAALNRMKSIDHEDRHSTSLIGNAADMDGLADEGHIAGKERKMHDLGQSCPIQVIAR